MKPSPMSRSPGTCMRTATDTHTANLSHSQASWKSVCGGIASPTGQPRLQLDSGSEGNPKNSTLGERETFFMSTLWHSVFGKQTPLCIVFSERQTADAMMPFIMDNKQITVMIFVKCCIATCHYALQCEWCSQWWASIKISGVPYGFVNIWNSLRLNKEKCFRSDAYFSFYESMIQHYVWLAMSSICFREMSSLSKAGSSVKGPGHLRMIHDLLCWYSFCLCWSVTLAVEAALCFKWRAVLILGLHQSSGGRFSKSILIFCSN